MEFEAPVRLILYRERESLRGRESKRERCAQVSGWWSAPAGAQERSCSLGSCGSWVIHWLPWEVTKYHGDHTQPTELCLLPPAIKTN